MWCVCVPLTVFCIAFHSKPLVMRSNCVLSVLLSNMLEYTLSLLHCVLSTSVESVCPLVKHVPQHSVILLPFKYLLLLLLSFKALSRRCAATDQNPRRWMHYILLPQHYNGNWPNCAASCPQPENITRTHKRTYRTYMPLLAETISR